MKWTEDNIRAKLEWARNEFAERAPDDKVSWEISPWPIVEQLLERVAELEKALLDEEEEHAEGSKILNADRLAIRARNEELEASNKRLLTHTQTQDKRYWERFGEADNAPE